MPPQTAIRAIVTWVPQRGGRLRQLFGHVVVTTSDEQSGEVAIGIRAHPPGFFGWFGAHVISILVALPLLGAILTFLARAVGRRDDRTAHALAVTTLTLQAAIAVYVYQGFAPEVSRLDGNDGLQFVEHAVWIRPLAAELYFGLDGTSVGPLLVIAFVALLGLVPDRTVPRGGASGYHAAYLVFVSAVTGALAAMDALLFVIFVSAAVVAATLLVGAWGGPDRRLAATKLAILGTLAVAALLVASLGVARNADPTFLVDGTKVTTTFSLPELSRVALGAKGAWLFGGALIKIAFGLVLFASVVLLGAFPMHGWLAPTLAEASTPVGALLAAALPSLGAVTLLRMGAMVVPEGTRWASGVVVALGAVSAAYGAFAALGEQDLRRLAAHATTSQVGFVLLGVGSLTPQGLSGGVMLVTTRALAAAAFLMLAGAVDDRVRTRDIERLTGVAAEMPAYATALATAALGQAGVMGLGGAWGPMLALFGALPNYAPLVLAAVGAIVVLTAGHLLALSRIAFGTFDESWRESPYLEPFGGTFPDLSPREWTGVAPLVLLVLSLGLWPTPLLSTMTGTVRDLTEAVNPPGPDQLTSRERPRRRVVLAIRE